jgi:cation diffusion facilitator family transporter
MYMTESSDRAAQPALDALRSERAAATWAIFVGAGLMLVKFAAYWLTGSSAIFSDALESIVNVLASGFALYAVVTAHRPADRDHPYGHGKVEFVAAALEGGMILLAAAVIFFRAVEEFVSGPGVHQLEWGLLLILLAMFANGGCGLYLLRRGRRSGSVTLQADGQHLLTDAATSLVVLVALLLMYVTEWWWIDPACAVLVSVSIAWVGARLVRRSMAGLMDEQDPADDTTLRGILNRHCGPQGQAPAMCSYHKLRHRHTGRFHWVDFHMVVPATWDVGRAHEAASAIEHEIEQALSQTDATAHIEPCAGCAHCIGKPLKRETAE